MTEYGMSPTPPHLIPHVNVSRETTDAQVAEDLVRETLEALCQRDGLSIESAAVPGEPARNYELADRLGIGHIFGLRSERT